MHYPGCRAWLASPCSPRPAKGFLPPPPRASVLRRSPFLSPSERRVCDAHTSDAEVYQMGCLLCMIWASLRWSDALWTPPSRIVLQLQQAALTGFSIRTKSSREGMPWGCLLSGLTGSASCSWGARFLSVLQQLGHNTRRLQPNRRIDFLPAILSRSAACPVTLGL